VLTVAQDLLIALCEEFEKECCVGLAHTIERHLREAGEARAAASPAWWKIHEATMLALGSAQEVIERQIQVKILKFSAETGIFIHVLLRFGLNCIL
jgi:hypothetical protein